jgi:hypothetical protein
VPDFLPQIIDEATKDMSQTSFLRLLLKILKPVISSAARRELDVEDKGMGALEKCAFSDTCVQEMEVKKPISTTATIMTGLTKHFLISSLDVSVVRIQAQTNLSISLDGVDVVLNAADTTAIALQCASTPFRLRLSSNENATFSVLFGSAALAPCNDQLTSRLPYVPGLVQRTTEDNLVGGPTTGGNSGWIAGLVIGMLLLAVVVAVAGVLLYRKKQGKKSTNEERLLPLNE